ncbi:hypothetical protein, partial [Photorhabdus akhurstii]|uniref:hypothetical protein n=1 Tax=Photorhabdus akhurstii TaxID=171438 RepID=UPI001BD423ED
AVALILGIIFSLLSIQITGCPKSVIEFNLMLEKVTLTFCDTLNAGGDIRRKARRAFRLLTITFTASPWGTRPKKAVKIHQLSR